MFQKIIQLIEKYPTVIIHRHSKPDGDALGSQMGLKYIIKETYPEKQVYVVGDTTPRYSFIADGDMDTIDDSAYENALAIILDSATPALVSDDRYSKAAATARLDHHIFVQKFADEEVVDTSFESCCGLIACMAKTAGLQVSSQAAKALYTGMITDSGRFRYDSINAQTFEMASFLISKGFDTNDIYSNLYSDELSSVQLRARFTLKINVTANGVGYIYNTLDEVASCGADTFTVSRGMVGVMSDVKGIHSWVNFTETENGVLCEIRSNKYNINPIAVKYGGGGHQKASGATLKDKDEAMQLLADLNAMGD